MKERLTGAIILVALIVLLVPELLTGPIRSPPSPAAARGPSAEEPPLRSYTIDLADESHAKEASANAGPPTPHANGPAQPAPISGGSVTGSSTSSSAANVGDSSSAADPAPAISTANGGSASVSDPAAAASSSLRTADAEAQREGRSVEPSAAGQQQKPAAGQQSLAGGQQDGAVRQQSLAGVQQDPAVSQRKSAVNQQNSAGAQQSSAAVGQQSSAPAENPVVQKSAAPKDAWMVQLGSFASRANAQRLAQQLKGQGFKASVSESGGRGRKWYRVRAGPAADRTAAEELATKLRAAGHPGSVVPRS